MSKADNNTVVMGPTFTPTELSSKNRINPAPPIGIGAFFVLLLLLLEVLRRVDMFHPIKIIFAFL